MAYLKELIQPRCEEPDCPKRASCELYQHDQDCAVYQIYPDGTFCLAHGLERVAALREAGQVEAGKQARQDGLG